MKILIRTDGSKSLGNGHIIRMLALAEELKSRQISCLFAMKFDDFWKKKVHQMGFEVTVLSNKLDHLMEFQNILEKNKITHLIYDTRHDLSRTNLDHLKLSNALKVIVIDTSEETRVAGDAVIFPPIPQVKEWNWIDFTGKIFCGWEYALLRQEFNNKGKQTRISKSRKILLSFGSTDPFFLSEKVLKQITMNVSLFDGYEFILLVGPQFDRLESIKESEYLEKLNLKIEQSPSDIVALFNSVEFAIISFGVTAYELATLSIPFMSISISDDHEKSVRIFVENSLCLSIGLIENLQENFVNIMLIYFKEAGNINQRIKEFQSRNNICNWPKIIDAIQS